VYLWNSGTLELWNSGTLELWNSGTLELWNSRNSRTPCWKSGNLAKQNAYRASVGYKVNGSAKKVLLVMYHVVNKEENKHC